MNGNGRDREFVSHVKTAPNPINPHRVLLTRLHKAKDGFRSTFETYFKENGDVVVDHPIMSLFSWSEYNDVNHISI